MLPLSLDVAATPVALVGQGPAAIKRLHLLRAAGAGQLTVFVPDPDAALEAAAGTSWRRGWPDPDLTLFTVIFAAGLDDVDGRALAARARAQRVLVNVEDVMDLCDFHVPSIVRRGSLLLTISTNGKAPGLSSRLRRHLEDAFGPEWGDRLDHVAEARRGWRADGADMAEVKRRTEALIEQEGWLS